MPQVRLETGRGMSVFEPLTITLNNSTTETTLFSTVIKGNKFGKTKRLTFVVDGVISTALSLVPTLSVFVKLGTTSMTIMNTATLGIGISNRQFHIEGYIAAMNDPAVQVVWSQIQQNSVSPTLAMADWTVDTTNDNTFAVTAQFGGISLGTSLSVKYATVEMS
jgi:hypothetical protein